MFHVQNGKLFKKFGIYFMVYLKTRNNTICHWSINLIKKFPSNSIPTVQPDSEWHFFSQINSILFSSTTFPFHCLEGSHFITKTWLRTSISTSFSGWDVRYLKWMKMNSDIPRWFLLCNAMLTIKKILQYKSDSVPRLFVVIPKINVSISSNSRVFRLKENFLHIKSIPINHLSRISWISINIKFFKEDSIVTCSYTCTLVFDFRKDSVILFKKATRLWVFLVFVSKSYSRYRWHFV